MVALKLVAFLFVASHVHDAQAKIYCKDDNGKDVDWVIAYKIPRIEKGDASLNTGYSYAYMTGKPISGSGEARTKGWKLSNKVRHE